MKILVNILLYFILCISISAQDYTVDKLATSINSEYDEITPILSRDGQTIFFTRIGYPVFDKTLFWKNEDLSTKLSPEDYRFKLAGIYGEIGDALVLDPEQSAFNQEIWIAQSDTSLDFQNPEHPSFPLNNALPNSIVAITPDPNAFYVINQFKEEGGMSKGFSLVRRMSGGAWAFPEPIEIKDYYTITSDVSLTMSFDGQILILSAARFDSRGMDLYVCFREGENAWSTPRHLGNLVNSEKRETTPFLSEDNTTLYFSSNRDGSYGGNDIYMTRRTDDSWQNWTMPVRLTDPINSSADDSQPYFNMTTGYLYFTSRRDGNSDVFRVQIAPPQPTEMVLKGRVIHAQTGDLIPHCTVYYGASGGPKNALDITDGYYSLKIPKGVSFDLAAEKKGYTGKTESISFRRDYYYFQDYYVLDLVLDGNGKQGSIGIIGDTAVKKADKPSQTPSPKEGTSPPLVLKVDTKIELKPIYFKQSKAEILEISFPELEGLRTILAEHPTLEIKIEGHTDNNGKERDLVRLSDERAKAIKTFLVSKGIKANRINTIGHGAKFPISDNGTEDSRQKNRRVEFIITKI